jgi:hypothetical protein
MSEAILATLGTGYAALAILLAVRVINRRVDMLTAITAIASVFSFGLLAYPVLVYLLRGVP